jgi:hypothetical protein
MNTNLILFLILGILLLCVIVFQLILTIKIWRTIGDMKEKPKTWPRPLAIGDKVIRISDGEQFFVSKIQNDEYICSSYPAFSRLGNNTTEGELQ